MTKSLPKPLKQPLRSCIACRTTSDKRALLRFVWQDAQGEVVLDSSGRMAGRGAYLCNDKQCFDRARKAGSFDRALKIKLSEINYQRLEAEFLCHSTRVDTV